MRTRLAASLLTAATVISAFSGCGSPAVTNAGTEQTTVASVTETTSEQQDTSASAGLSVPVKLNADGDIDMDTALAYQTDIDGLIAKLDAKTVSPDHPVSDNTNEETLALYRWLKEQFDSGKTISAQMLGNKSWMEDVAYYYYTDDLPAIMGFDFIFKTTPTGDDSDWTQMAIDWHTKSGGIVYFCWHWNVPCDINDPNNNGYAFYSNRTSNSAVTNFSLANAVTPGTEEYKIAIHDIDLIAKELQRLEAAGVPVLWRPLHEASGNWFWWGLSGKEDAENQYYQKLWYMIYDRLENYHKLTNLIWVWNGQSKHCTVHENTYDIAGIDVYPNTEDHSVQEKSYKDLTSYTADGKMTALSECGYIPDPDELAANADKVKWLFYMPWNFDFIYKGSTVLGIPRLNEERMSADFLKKVMSADNIITWSELPAFEGTEKNLPERISMMYFDMQKQKEKDEAEEQ